LNTSIQPGEMKFPSFRVHFRNAKDSNCEPKPCFNCRFVKSISCGQWYTVRYMESFIVQQLLYRGMNHPPRKMNHFHKSNAKIFVRKTTNFDPKGKNC
jgi:hypothetical protein